ncbi:MAG: endonuclease/exonuclease/phosphatase family protein [Verrucomicrobia bacterium]|nr:endonuclease/exonuclease/phosphatase family protein [Leptolyngbya sp. ES-bin-22]
MVVSKRRSSFNWFFTVVLAVGLGLITLLSLAGSLAHIHWLLDLTAHFKLQYLVVSTSAFVCLWFWHGCLWKRWLLNLSLSCLLLNLVDIVPWYVPSPSVVAPTVQLRLLHANVLVRNRDYERVMALVKAVKPEIAVFQEVNAGWLQALEPLRTLLPYMYAEPNAAGFGNAIYSALPLQQPSVQFLGQTEYASLVVQVSKGGQTFSLMTTHPPPPIREELFQWRNQWLAAIAPFVRSQTHPVIVIGDFNVSMWSPYYRQAVQAAGLKNTRTGFGILPSWSPRGWLPWLAIPIDHCLVSPELFVQKTQIGRHIGSDHRPLLVELAM